MSHLDIGVRARDLTYILTFLVVCLVLSCRDKDGYEAARAPAVSSGPLSPADSPEQVLSTQATASQTLDATIVVSGEPRGRSPLSFDKRCSECLNHWAAWPSSGRGGQGLHAFGFVYIDPSMGFTIHHGGAFIIDDNGAFIKERNRLEGKAVVLKRVSAEFNAIPAALLPPDRLEELGLSEKPDWLSFYEDEAIGIEHQIKWGYHFNHVGDSRGALSYLEPVYREDPNAKGVVEELSYAYNALGRHADAIKILIPALRPDNKSVTCHRELAYAYLNGGEPARAVQIYQETIDLCPENDLLYKSELALALANAYRRLGDEANYRHWISTALQWAPEKTPLRDYLERECGPKI